MLASLLLALSLQQSPGVDSVQVYAAILNRVRDAYPELPVLMSETRKGVACMPHCGAQLRDLDAEPADAAETPTGNHSSQVLDSLRRLELIDRTCPVQERVFGCLGHPGYLFVALGEISEAPDGGPAPVRGGVWVRTAFLVPCTTNCRERSADEPYFPDAFGLWFLLQPREDGTWEIVRNVPAFAI
jgi:hypothetical protein